MVVAFGGRTDPSAAVFSRETWLWDGSAWSLAIPNGPDLEFSLAAFDENSQQVLLYGSRNGGPQTWTWDGAQWHSLAVSSPPARALASMAFDPGSKRLILFGGFGLNPAVVLNDTWAWNGTSWSELAPQH
jgi:hypothetical protein